MLEGLPPNNAAHVMRLTCDEPTARRVADIVVETFDPAETAAAAFEAEPNAPVWRTCDWVVDVFFGTAPDEAMVRDLIATAVGRDTAENLVFERVSERDWVKASLDGLAPVRAGRFLVHGAHHRDRVHANDIGLEIEAALAFGTGHHGTTRGCLLMLDRLLKAGRPGRILDIGTGTGVLAMAAAKSLRMTIAASDIDPIAVTAARANARQNRLAPYLHPLVSKGVRHPALVARAPYDLIFANILAKPLRRLAPSVAGVAAPGAHLVLSGLLGTDVAGVLSAYRAQGFALVRRLNLDGWSSLLLRRGGLSPRPRAPIQGLNNV